MKGEGALFFPPVVAVCVATLEEDSHGLVGGAGLHLEEVGLRMSTLRAGLCVLHVREGENHNKVSSSSTVIRIMRWGRRSVIVSEVLSF